MKSYLMRQRHGGFCFEGLGSGYWCGIASVNLVSSTAVADPQAVVAWLPLSAQS